MKIFMRILTVFALFSLIAFFLHHINTYNVEVFNPKGVIALAEKNLLVTAFCLMMIVVIPIFIMLFTFLWRYRASNTKAKYAPDWHTNTTLEIVWWFIPAVIVILLSLITWKSTHDLDPYKPLNSSVKPVTVEVVALDWKWLFIYPEENIATVNFLVIPKDTPINLKITSDAPMNGFWVPQLAGQVYAMPGMTAQLHLLANEAGDYRGMSTNFSGDGFSGMKFVTHVTNTSEEYGSWLQLVRESPYSLTNEEYAILAKQSKNNPATYYSSVEKNLYTQIVMKFMMPKEKLHEMKMSAMQALDVSSSSGRATSTNSASSTILEMPTMEDMMEIHTNH